MPATKAQPETTFRADRFRDLIDAVEGAPEERFDMECWAHATSCGTAGCACGWYAMFHPELFRVRPQRNQIFEISSGVEFWLFQHWAGHFGIDTAEASRLFDASEYGETTTDTSKANVLARLRDFYTTKTQQEPAHV